MGMGNALQAIQSQLIADLEKREHEIHHLAADSCVCVCVCARVCVCGARSWHNFGKARKRR